MTRLSPAKMINLQRRQHLLSLPAFFRCTRQHLPLGSDWQRQKCVARFRERMIGQSFHRLFLRVFFERPIQKRQQN